MKRTLIILVVIGLILIVGSLLLRACDRGSGEPSASLAQYQIIADNRIYYTNKYTQGVDKYGQYIILNGYWAYDGTYWKRINIDYYLSYRGYHNIQIKDRVSP